MRPSPFLSVVFALFLCIIAGGQLAACAKDYKESAAQPAETLPVVVMHDPLETMNRAVFSFNDMVDTFVLVPVAKGYNKILPVYIRDGVQNFFRNLRSPIIFANNLLQADFGDAGVTLGRFLLNTTLGLGGVMDIAATQGMPYRSEDLGQTLAVWGLGDGFYVVLPLLGPSSLRDTAGFFGDSFADPVRIWSFKTGRDWIYYTRNVVESIDTRSRLLDAIADLRRNSLDYYAAVRSAYAQKRQSLIKDQTNELTTEIAIPDYEDHP